MPDKFKKDDLRIVKTHKALVGAMSQTLELRNFNQITVNDLCEKAQISRATFYAHFDDKYDFLRYWLGVIQTELMGGYTSYEEVEGCINSFAASHYRSIHNLLVEANPETAELLRDFIITLLHLPQEKNASEPLEAQQTVLNKFCAGGVYNYLLWQANNKFTSSLPLINRHLYDIITVLRNSSPK